MINFGPYSGANMPEVRMRRQPLDWVLEGITAILLLTFWILTFAYYPQLSGSDLKECWGSLGVVTLVGILGVWSSHASIRFYNFPVRVNERNYVTQYILASRAIRLVAMCILFLFFFRQMGLFAGFWNLDRSIFHVASFVALSLLFILMIVYYILAMRYRG